MRRSSLSIFWLWVVARIRLLLRSPRLTFFTLVFPVILLVTFDGLNHSRVTAGGGELPFAQFFTPSIAVFALVSATYTGLIFGVVTAREQGILKRVRGTPLPMRVFLGSWVASTLLTGFTAVVLMFVVAVPAFGVHVYPGMLPAAAVTLLLGGASFCALAMAVASYVKRTDTAPVVANLTLFPLMFISGVFYPMEGEPHWLQTIARLFPLSHLTQAFDACFSSHTAGAGFLGRDLFALALWGAVGGWIAVRRFAAEETDEPVTRGRGRLRAAAAHARGRAS
jgi:ABC-2 type transport system permease protein